MDIACGSLRAGIHFIPYLNEGNYLGIDKELSLIELGLEHELGKEMEIAKAPEFVVSNSFEFDKFSKVPDFAIAQSLFTHLPPPYIHDCLDKLSQHFQPGGTFFATFFVIKRKIRNPKIPHDHQVFSYTKAEIKDFGRQNGWNVEYIGDWSHPRNQQMVKYKLRG